LSAKIFAALFIDKMGLDGGLQRTIPHKDGDTKITVFPAKDGYIMVSEYNKKEKYTKFSIEAL